MRRPKSCARENRTWRLTSLLSGEFAKLSALLIFAFCSLSLIEFVFEQQEEASATNPKDQQLSERCLWPDESDDCAASDRILNQLEIKSTETEKFFKILPPADDFSLPEGQEVFIREECPVSKCQITFNSQQADALIFQNSDVSAKWHQGERSSDQIWIAYFLESPSHTFDGRFERAYRGKHLFNWTASYRRDSDIVTPYSKFVPYKNQVRKYELLKGNLLEDEASKLKFYASASESHKKLIRGKRGAVAWFASNCNAANKRLEYARELSKHIQVDIYGKCGNYTCEKWNQTNCFRMLNERYKFYLSFENSNCREYVTEKLFRNAYGYNDPDYLLLPIVMGAPQSDYEDLAPAKSFIHVDQFGSPKELAEYLHQLDQDESAYYSYFRWKTMGRFVETRFLCRVCAMLHEAARLGKRKWYSDVKSWWRNYPVRNSTKACES